MGTMCGCAPNKISLIKFQDKNKYTPQNFSAKTNERQQILASLAPNIFHENKHINIAHYISQHKNKKFIDSNFQNLEITGLPGIDNKEHIHRLYNFHIKHINKVYQTSFTPFENFKQNQLELTYLSSVFFLICQSQSLKKHLFITKIINKYDAYIIRLFCNGQPTEVIVDDLIPTVKSQIKYTEYEKGSEIWPLLLEKAWCKQIGGYDKALGLSPEDCFQQITGIPAQTFLLNFFESRHLVECLQQYVKQGYWISFVAKTFYENDSFDKFRSKQVFVLEGLHQAMQQLTESNDQQTTLKLRSSYCQSRPTHSSLMYNSRRTQSEDRIVSIGELKQIFEYMTVGYCRKEFSPYSHKFKSGKFQEKVFNINVYSEIDLSIRLVQFYDEYITHPQKQFYQYSPVLMQLYDNNFCLIEECQIFSQGSHSVSICKNGFIRLPKGYYHLRVHVDWMNQTVINQANIVVYNRSETNQQFLQVKNCQSDQKQFSAKLLANSLIKSRAMTQIKKDKQNLAVRVLQKDFRYVIGIYNYDRKKANLKLVLKNSHNLKINHQNIKLQHKTVQLSLEPEEQAIWQLIPEDNKQKINLGSFDIIKL